MKWRALVFDLDDTLFAEREFVLSGFVAVDRWLQEERAITGFAAEAGRLFASGIRGRVFDEALHRLRVEGGADPIQQMVEVYRAHEPRLTLLPEAEWVLESYRGLLRLGLITDGYARTQRNKVAALGIGGRFDSIVYTDDLGRANWKPSPVPFRLMMDRLGCAGEECVYVADNPAKDFIAPNGLGWQTVQIRRAGGEYGGTPVSEVEPSHRARCVISSLLELRTILG
jgi:putative hydrolase of the HAD superfamily